MKKSKIWLTGDTHFNHKKILTLGNGRPKNYENKLFKSLKEISSKDTLIHLGDICIGKDKEIHAFIRSLACKKILIRGNHDKKSTSWYIRNGWDFVCHETVIKEEGQLILLKHKPIGKESAQNIDIHIHGHHHGNLQRIITRNHSPEEVLIGGTYDKKWHYDIAPDNHNYQIIGLETIISKMRERNNQ